MIIGASARASRLAMAPSLMVTPNTSSISRARRSKLIAWVTCRCRISAARPGPKGEPGALGARCAEPPPTAWADAAMPVNPGYNRLDRRQVDMVVGMKLALVGGAQRAIAMR